MRDLRPLLVIAGPTGVGKTAAAVALAARVPLEVISADSRQVYRGMDVATGKATPGRPVLYGTTPIFLEHFALRHLEELPRADELAIALRVQTPEGDEYGANGA